MDQSQNVTVVYKFDTTQVEKGNQHLKEANDLSNKLQQSAAKVGGGFTTSSGKVINSVASMNDRLKEMKTTMDSMPLTATKKLGAMSAEYKKLEAHIKSTTTSLYEQQKATKAAAGGVNDLVVGFRDLSKFAGAAIISALAQQVVSLGLSLSTLQGRVEGVERGFNKAFTTPLQTLSEVREATHGTMTDFELMQRSLQATNLGVGVEHLGTLFEFASARAQQTGESVDYLVDSIVRGIGRKSPLVLDNLGISVTALKEKFDGASIASVSVAEATRGVAEIAKEQMEKMGGYVETAETKVKNLGRSLEEFKITFSKRLNIGGFLDSITNAIEGAEKLMRSDQEDRERADQLNAEIRAKALLNDKLNKDMIKDEKELTKAFEEEIDKRVNIVAENTAEIRRLEQSAAQNRKAAASALLDEGTREKFHQAMLDDAKAAAGLMSENRELIATLRILRAEFVKLQDPEVNPIDTLEELREEVKKLTEEFDAWITIGNSESPEAKSKIKAIKDLNKQIEILEALLKDPKELKLRTHKIKTKFKEGVDTSPLTFLPEGINPLSEGVFEELAANAGDKAGPTFFTHFKRAFKRMPVGELEEDLMQGIIDLEVAGIDILADQLSSIADLEANTFRKRLNDTKEFYDQQQVIAGNNEKAKDILRLREMKQIDELRKKQFKAEQESARKQTIINGAAGIVKAFVTAPNVVVAIAQGLLIAAATASQLAIINRQQPKFAKGVIDLQGPGTSTSDSIQARLSKHETVMPAWATKNSRGIFEDIMARRLDDRVLRNLRDSRRPVVSAGFDDRNIVRAIKDNRPPDIIEQNGIVYKARKKSEDYINKVRAKSVKI